MFFPSEYTLVITTIKIPVSYVVILIDDYYSYCSVGIEMILNFIYF